jgi:LAO/AO transport system ATPase
MQPKANTVAAGTSPSLDDLFSRFRQGDRRALSRLVSLVARGEQVGPIQSGVGRPAKPARVVALTGAGGVGKSTLAGKLIETIRGRNLRVAVLACDPQSPLSGGALLGDRFRMPSRPDDDGVFIRSLAAAGGRGALADHLDALTRLLEAFGFDVVLIETVGAGQGDTAVLELADVLVLLVQPETGDDLQWEKAGLLEVADVVVVHKADLPGADRVEAQVITTLGLSTGRVPPVLRASARNGSGLEEMWDVIAGLPLRRATDSAERDLLRLGQEAMALRFAAERRAGSRPLTELVERWRRGELAASEAGASLLQALMKGESSRDASSPR